MEPTTTEEPPTCGHSDIVVTVETDKKVYRAPDEAVITVRATNVSGHDCQPSGMSLVRVFAADGQVVFEMPPNMVAYTPGARWPADATKRDEVRWDLRCDRGNCEGAQASVGEYVVEATWLRDYGPARTSIRVVSADG